MSGPAVATIDIALTASAWTELGFIVTDGFCTVGTTRLRLGAEGEPGTLPGWELTGRADGPQTIDGVVTRWVEDGAQVSSSPDHPIGATRIDHVVVGTPDVDRTLAALQAAGMTLRRERNAGSTRSPMRQGFFRHGEAIVEVVGPAEPGGDGPAALWGLVVVVADIDAAVEQLGSAGGRVRDAVQPGRRITTVRSEAVSGLPLALMTD